MFCYRQPVHLTSCRKQHGHCWKIQLLDNGYQELAITSVHAVSIDSLPAIHKDPFDRILIAQATIEGITLLTADAVVAQYPGPLRQV